MRFFHQMRQNEALPAPRENVLTANRVKAQTAARLAGLHEQVYLGIVPQRLVMSHALHGVGDRLLINDAALVECDLHRAALGDHARKNLHLHLAHELHPDLLVTRIPDGMELRVLLRELLEAQKRLLRRDALLRNQPVFQHRQQHRRLLRRLHAESVARLRMAQPRDRADRSGIRRLGQRVLCTGIDAELIGLFFPAVAGKERLDAQAPARDLQKRQPRALRVARDLENARAEVPAALRLVGVGRDAAQKRIHSRELQRRAEPARENAPARDEAADVAGRKLARLKIALRRIVIRQRELLKKLCLLAFKIHAPL